MATDLEKLSKFKNLDSWLLDYVSDVSKTYGGGTTTFADDICELMHAILHDEKLEWDSDNSLYNLIKEYADGDDSDDLDVFTAHVDLD
jgi:hypothetical protein